MITSVGNFLEKLLSQFAHPKNIIHDVIHDWQMSLGHFFHFVKPESYQKYPNNPQQNYKYKWVEQVENVMITNIGLSIGSAKGLCEGITFLGYLSLTSPKREVGSKAVHFNEVGMTGKIKSRNKLLTAP